MSKYFTGVLSKSSTPGERAKDISDKFNDWHGDMEELRTKARQYYDYFKGIPPERPSWAHPDTPNYFVPYMETLVDTIAAKFFLTLFARDPIIRYQPMDRKSVLATKLAERVIHYYLNHRTPNALTNLYLWVVDAVLQGYGFLHIYWEKRSLGSREFVPKESTRVEEVQFSDEQSPDAVMADEDLVEPVVRERVTYEGFQFSVLDIENFAANFTETDITKTPIIVREWIDPEEYMCRVTSMEYEDLSEEEIESAIQDYRVNEDDTSQDSTTTSKKLELLHYYGKGYLGEDDTSLQDVKITVLRGLTKQEDGSKEREVRRNAIGLKPVCCLRMKPEKNSLGGRGVGDQTFDLNTELNINFNARLLNLSMSLHRMFKIGTGAGLKGGKDSLISRPGGIIEAEDISLIEEMAHQPLPPDAFNSSRETIGYMQDVTAAQDIIQGKASRQELATTATLMDSNAKQRLELHVFRMAKEGLSQVGDILIDMLVTMHDPQDPLFVVMSKDEMEKFGPQLTSGGQSMVDDNGFMEVRAGDLSGAMFADTEVSATDGDKRSVRQEMLQLLQTTMQLIPQGTPTGETTPDGSIVMEKVNVSRWIRELFSLWGRVDFKDFITRFEVQMQQPGAPGAAQTGAPSAEPPGASVPPPVQELQAMINAADQRMATGGE